MPLDGATINQLPDYSVQQTNGTSVRGEVRWMRTILKQPWPKTSSENQFTAHLHHGYVTATPRLRLCCGTEYCALYVTHPKIET